MDINAVPYQQHLPHSIRLPGSGVPAASTSASMSKPVFEFTKRKKWDDLLLSEIHLTILFILSLSSQQSSSKILFTGYNTALSDVLGYNDSELVDSAFGDIMNERDGQVWQSIVDDAVRAHNPGTIGMFVRLKRKPPPPPLSANSDPMNQLTSAWPPSPPSPTSPPPPPDILFEIRGHVHFADPQPTSQAEPLCVLATATPYPSTVSNALNSFLEQKIEHERLLKRVRTLQARSNDRSLAAAQQDHPSMITDLGQNYLYPNQSHPSQFNLHRFPLSIPSSINPSDPRLSLHTLAPSDRTSLYQQAGASMSYPSGASPLTSTRPPALPQLEEDEERRKKLKKAPQYVCITCGRTDSPEWRKGPQGPKTLCNACGLRWAKKARKLDGVSETTKMAH